VDTGRPFGSEELIKKTEKKLKKKFMLMSPGRPRKKSVPGIGSDLFS
jgi:hypothetical protein